MSQRRRDPPPPKATCLRCGWSGTPNHTFLRDEHGDVSLVVSQKPCPKCGEQTIQLEPPPPLPVEIATALRDADLTYDQLVAAADALGKVPSDASPRAVAEQVPLPAKLITVASRVGKDQWIGILVAVIALAIAHVQHTDAERAHQDAEQAHQDAEQAHEDAERTRQDSEQARRTGSLSDDDVKRIAEKVEAAIRDARP